MNISSSEYFYEMFKEAFSNYYFLTFLCLLLLIYVVFPCKENFDNREANKTTEENNLKLNLKKTKEDNLETFKDNFLEKAS